MADAAAGRELGGLRAKFFLAVGSIGWGVKDAGMGLLFLFYTQVLGTPPFLAGLAIGLALVADAFMDPIIGVVSDNWRSRWGRRHPFMYAAAIPVGILYYLIWTPNAHLSDYALFAYLLVVAVLLRGAIALYEIPSSALVAELTPDYAKRTEFLSWRWFFGVMGATAISVAAFSLWLIPDATHKIGQLNPAGYPKMAFYASIVMTLSILVSCLGLHRYIPHLIQSKVETPSIGKMARELWQTLKIKPFFVLILSGIFSSMAAGLSGVMGPYLLTFFWKLNSGELLKFTSVGVLSAALAFAIVVPATKRLEKKFVAIGAGIVGIVFGTGPYVLGLFGWVPDFNMPWLLPLLLALFVIMSAVGIAGSVMTGSMIADVVEYTAIQTGRRSEGTLFAALSLVNKSVSGSGFVLSGLVVKLSQFPEHANPATLDPDVIQHLLAVYIPILLVLYAFAIFFFNQYKITRTEHEENVKRLAAELEVTTVGADGMLLAPDAPKDAGAQPSPAAE